MDTEERFSNSTTKEKILTNEERAKLEHQNNRIISNYTANKINIEAKKHWDLFYKRNETRFFKDRHWTTREFEELLGKELKEESTLLEIGCGVGNFIYPLIEEKLNIFIYACDLSSKAIDLLKVNSLYSESKINAFQNDITTDDVFNTVPVGSVDIATLIFVLSAIDPSDHPKIVKNLYSLVKPGGFVLFRDYGLYDMAQLRFKAGHKISDNFYMRQDGTRSYFFSIEYLGKIFEEAGFTAVSNCYINRRTINVKEGVDVPRIFVQAKFKKSS